MTMSDERLAEIREWVDGSPHRRDLVDNYLRDALAEVDALRADPVRQAALALCDACDNLTTATTPTAVTVRMMAIEELLDRLDPGWAEAAADPSGVDR